jgi:tetratricopeptide (TPR) repeat protein
MGKSRLLFLNFLFLSLAMDAQHAIPKVAINCLDRRVQDSLVVKYIDNGAEKLGDLYNDPAWQLYCDSILTICPQVAAAYRSKAIPYIKNGEYETAMALEDKAVSLDPQTWTSYRGFLKCIFTKDYEGALVDFKESQRLWPEGYEMDHTFLFFEAICHLEMGEFAKAENDFRQDIRIQTKGDTSQDVHFNTSFYMGVLYYEMKDYTKSKNYIRKCLNTYSQHPEANFYMGLNLAKEGSKEQSQVYFKFAKQYLEKGYSLNEANHVYVNFPHEIRMQDVNAFLMGTK